VIPEPLRRLVAAAFSVLSFFSEGMAAKAAFRLFTTPIGGRKVRISGARLESALAVMDTARQEIHDGIATWIWETGGETRTVVLVHGWTSMSLYMTSLVEPLRGAGFRVVAFDFPGHGESAGTQLTSDHAAGLAVGIADRFGRTALVGHSFGASMCVIAASGAPTLEPSPNIEALVLVAGANELQGVTQRFADQFGIGPRVKRRLDQRLEKIGGAPIDRFSTVNGVRAAGVPTLLVHDQGDTIVPFSDAEAVHAETGAELVETARLGHNRILYSRSVHRVIVEFVAKHVPAEDATAGVA
jgi:pimeloyl-ACP methyl ester carboxylesterase